MNTNTEDSDMEGANIEDTDIEEANIEDYSTTQRVSR